MLDDLSMRQRAPELMDGADLALGEHIAALNGLERLNLLALQARPFWREIAPLARSAQAPLRVLDLACGGGGLVCALRRKAARAGLALVVDGCDRSPVAVANAQQRAERLHAPGGAFFVHDLSTDGPPEGYDVLTNTLFLHHLDEIEAAQFLRDLSVRADRLVLLSDILRTRMGLLMVQVACRALGGSRIVVEDGRTSLRAAFSMPELRELARRGGLEGASLQRHWPERAMLRWERPPATSGEDTPIR
jgi:2-polyprenyl-3-methyl-5-hydroxy-6-metoxy-1,4-benzoquinol methylase